VKLYEIFSLHIYDFTNSTPRERNELPYHFESNLRSLQVKKRNFKRREIFYRTSCSLFFNTHLDATARKFLKSVLFKTTYNYIYTLRNIFVAFQ